MAEERHVFGMLGEISDKQTEILNELIGVKQQANESDSRIEELEKEIKNIKAQANRPFVQPKQQPSQKEIFRYFLKQAKKSWRWFGSMSEFKRTKALAVISLLILLIIGFATSIISTICFKMYSTFTFFENVWMVFAVIYLVFAFKTKPIYEVNALATNSSKKYETDQLGMKFPRKEKLVFRIFKWITIISVPFNIICIWAGLGKNNQILATVMEVLFLGAIIFAYFVNMNLFAQYSIIWVEGHNLTTKERVVLVLPPGTKQLMPEEEFKKKMPFFYE